MEAATQHTNNNINCIEQQMSNQKRNQTKPNQTVGKGSTERKVFD